MRPLTVPTFSGVSVYVQPGPASWKPVTAVETAVVPMLPLLTVFKPWFVTPAEPPNEPNAEAEPSATDGEGGIAQLTAVNVHVVSASIVLAGTARSTAPVVPLRMRAVYTVPATSGAAGVKVAMRPVAASSTTEEATTADGPFTVNTEELIEFGSIRRPEGTA